MKVILILLMCLATLSCSKKGPHHPDQWGALVACQDSVKNRLKNPRSAEFESSSNASITEIKKVKLGTGYKTTYQVLGFVYAQNSFGGAVRTKYGCDVMGRTQETGYPKWTVYNVVVM